MSRTWLTASLIVCTFSFGCGGDDGGGEGAAGELNEPCLGGVYCNDDLVCTAGVCTASGTTGDGDGDSGTGETAAPGDGDPGDGDPGDGDGEPAALLGLYQGPCLSSDECEGDLWCSTQNGRFWCASGCVEDVDCPAHASASAMPTCEYLSQTDGSGTQLGCVLSCETEDECPVGAQCFGAGIASKTWCGFL